MGEGGLRSFTQASSSSPVTQEISGNYSQRRQFETLLSNAGIDSISCRNTGINNNKQNSNKPVRSVQFYEEHGARAIHSPLHEFRNSVGIALGGDQSSSQTQGMENCTQKGNLLQQEEMEVDRNSQGATPIIRINPEAIVHNRSVLRDRQMVRAIRHDRDNKVDPDTYAGAFVRWLFKVERDNFSETLAAEATNSLKFLTHYRQLVSLVDSQRDKQKLGGNRVHPVQLDFGELSTDTRTVTFETLQEQKAVIFTAAQDLSGDRYPLQYLFQRFNCQSALKKQGMKPGQVAVLTLQPSQGNVTLLVPIVKKTHKDPVRPHTWLKCVLELRYWIERLALESVYFIVLTENMDDYTERDAWIVLVEALKDTDVRVRMASIMASK
jgi:hypothetical protein